MTIEFTDRYGGRAPSWLRGCHGDCEAMGWMPVQRPEHADTHADLMEDRLFSAAHIEAGEHECDGWHFVPCPSCGGSGRVSWAVTVGRIPRWLWKGVTFYRFAMQPAVSPDGWTWQRRFKNYLNAAFLEDLRRLSR